MRKKQTVESLCNDMDRYILQMKAGRKEITAIVLSPQQYKTYLESNMGIPEYRGIPLRAQEC